MKHIHLRILACILFLFAVTHIHAQIYICTSGKTSFYSTGRIENIEATSNKTNVVLNTATNEVLVKMQITSFVFKNGLMQDHFNETYMESDQYPYAQFKGKINGTVHYTVAGEYPVTVTGSLYIHGVTVERIISGTIKVAQGSVTLVADFIVSAAAHKIDIPKDKISNISQEIKISTYAICTPYVKK
jgi:polyisoprenoid-binding protein YceI